MSPTRIRYRLAGVAVAALAAAAATPVTLASAAPAATGSPSATVSPGTVAPGGRVSLNVEGCGTKTGRATSRAFGNVSLTPGNLEATNLFGAATVYRDAPTGSHPVTFECGGTGGRARHRHPPGRPRRGARRPRRQRRLDEPGPDRTGRHARGRRARHRHLDPPPPLPHPG